MSSTGEEVTLDELAALAARLSELRARTGIPALDTALRHAETYVALARISLGDTLLAPWSEGLAAGVVPSPPS
ncbi:MAG: hypothetical protein AB1679_24610 [Actinomycetota bacterium]